jgi:hypothetical protein
MIDIKDLQGGEHYWIRYRMLKNAPPFNVWRATCAYYNGDGTFMLIGSDEELWPKEDDVEVVAVAHIPQPANLWEGT